MAECNASGVEVDSRAGEPLPGGGATDIRQKVGLASAPLASREKRRTPSLLFEMAKRAFDKSLDFLVTDGEVRKLPARDHTRSEATDGGLSQVAHPLSSLAILEAAAVTISPASERCTNASPP